MEGSHFITRATKDNYKIIFETDSINKYHNVQDACRIAIDHAKPNVVEVVRCKDCIRGELETEGAAKGYINCPYQGYGELHPQDWYCADGIRKGD